MLESEDLGYRPDFLTNGRGDYGMSLSLSAPLSSFCRWAGGPDQ